MSDRLALSNAIEEAGIPRVVELLRVACDVAGGKHPWAKAHGISNSQVFRVLSGKQRPGRKIMAALGIDPPRRLPHRTSRSIDFWNFCLPVPHSGCWLWEGAVNRDGYGQLRDHVTGRTMLAHHHAYRQIHGAIPDGMSVLHHCDVPSCVNPDHLFSGTNDDNVADKVKKGRQRGPRGAANGQTRLTDDDVQALRASSESSDVLGIRYGISRGTVWRIRTHKVWRRLP